MSGCVVSIYPSEDKRIDGRLVFSTKANGIKFFCFSGSVHICAFLNQHHAPGSWDRSCGLERQLTAEALGFWVGQAGAMLSGTSLEIRASALTFLAPPALFPQPFQLGGWKLRADDEGV